MKLANSVDIFLMFDYFKSLTFVNCYEANEMIFLGNINT